jgi:hypothetical protein
MKNEKTFNPYLIGLSYLTGLNIEALNNFIINNNLSIDKLYNKIVKMNINEKITFITSVAGNKDNLYQKNIIKTFKS